MTNHWIDIKNSDVIFMIGSNAAENHPASFRWILKAMEERGAKLIVVDPRFSKSASMASLYVPIRPGTDLAYLGGIINYALERNLIQKEYVLEYTNASYLVNPDYKFNDGLFSGYDAGKRNYGDRKTWTYQMDAKKIPKQDKTLKNPQCVYQLMKNHYSRYTPEMVEKVTGCPKETFLKSAEIYCSTHKPDRVANFMYAMGITQHTVGTQNVRALAILQLLMGNMGLAGGGINALRGESNVQGSTDHGLLFHLLTAYMPAPNAKEHATLEAYNNTTPKTEDPMSINWWSNRPKYLASMLKAWYGDAATKKNNFCYDFLPKYSKPAPYILLFEDMMKGIMKGAFFMGTNPIVGGPNANRNAQAIEKLDWLVAVDLWETDSSTFWKRPGANPAQIKTEVFLLPAASSVEKEGSISNSGRWAQWRYKAVNPPGKAKSDLDILDTLFRQLRDLYKKEGGKFPDPILKSNWNYVEEGEHEASPHLVAKEINGYTWPDKKQMSTFMDLKDDGSTACGCWIYCGSYPGSSKNLMARRGTKDASNGIGTFPEWSWCWPLNRRIIYNRAAVNRKGEPWDADRWIIKWNGSKWKGDVVDGGPKFGPEAKNPFIMNNEGVGRLFSPGKALTDGPFTEHYEPMESPTPNLFNSQKVNPAANIIGAVAGQFGSAAQFPCIATSYRVVEHWQAGAMTRNLPWLTELVPDMFCEISTSLAATKGIKNGDRVSIFNARGTIKAYALVTERVQPIMVNGRAVEMIGLIWHFGPGGAATGDAANQLTPSIGDANTMIPEFKAFLADIRKEA
jgi:formate dehydrogenase-N alpha subunit